MKLNWKSREKKMLKRTYGRINAIFQSNGITEKKNSERGEWWTWVTRGKKINFFTKLSTGVDLFAEVLIIKTTTTNEVELRECANHQPQHFTILHYSEAGRVFHTFVPRICFGNWIETLLLCSLKCIYILMFWTLFFIRSSRGTVTNIFSAVDLLFQNVKCW